MFTEGSVVSDRIVNTPSSFAKDSLLYVQETGSLRALRPHTSIRSKLASYLFFIVERGEGTLEYCGRRYELADGDCVFLDCMLPYSHTAGEALWELRWVHFDSRFMDTVYERYAESGGRTVFHPDDVAPFSSLLSRMYESAHDKDNSHEMKLNELLASLLTLITDAGRAPGDAASGKESADSKSVLREIREYVDAHWAERITLDSIAERFYINKFYLTRLFKSRYGTTLVEYVLDLRITNAKKMLRFSDRRIEAIARECGFEDPNYFSRAFKKIEGVTPSKYRTMWTNAN